MKIRVNRVFLEDDEREDRTHLLTGCASSEYKRKRPPIPCKLNFSFIHSLSTYPHTFNMFNQTCSQPQSFQSSDPTDTQDSHGHSHHNHEMYQRYDPKILYIVHSCFEGCDGVHRDVYCRIL